MEWLECLDTQTPKTDECVVRYIQRFRGLLKGWEEVHGWTTVVGKTAKKVGAAEKKGKEGGKGRGRGV